MRNSSEFPSVNTQKTADNWRSLCLSLIGDDNRNSLEYYRYEPLNSGAAENETNRNAESDALHRCFGGDV